MLCLLYENKMKQHLLTFTKQGRDPRTPVGWAEKFRHLRPLDTAAEQKYEHQGNIEEQRT